MLAQGVVPYEDQTQVLRSITEVCKALQKEHKKTSSKYRRSKSRVTTQLKKAMNVELDEDLYFNDMIARYTKTEKELMFQSSMKSTGASLKGKKLIEKLDQIS